MLNSTASLGRTHCWPPRAPLRTSSAYLSNRPDLVREDRRTHGSPGSAGSADRLLRLAGRQRRLAGRRRGRPRARAAPTSTPSPGWRRSSRRSPRSRTSPGTMSLSFRDHRFEPPKNTVDECKDRDVTYAAPLFVTAEFMNNETGEIKSQTVFMGDFPLMTDKGTFVINGTERVVVSQLVRSPGVYFEQTTDKTSDKDIFTCKMIPSRGAWLEFEIDKRDMVGVRLDRKRKQNVTVLLKALGWDDAKILEEFGEYESMRLTLEKDHTTDPGRGAARHLPQAPPGRAADPRGRAGAAGELLLQPEAVRPGQGRSVQDQQEARPGASPFDKQVLTVEDIVAAIRFVRRAARGPGDPGRPARRADRRRGRHRPLRQPPAAYGGRADPEPAAHRSRPDGAGRPGPDDHPGRRGDHAADPDQHPAGGGGAEGVLRHLPAQPVHGPDQPDRRSDPQAAAVGARPGRSVPRPRRHGGPRRAHLATTAGCARSRPRKARTSA